MKLQSEILRQHLRLETSLKADQSHLHWSCYCLSFTHVHDAKVIKQHFLLQLTINNTATLSIKKKVRLLPLSIIENSVRHNIARIISKSKANIP